MLLALVPSHTTGRMQGALAWDASVVVYWGSRAKLWVAGVSTGCLGGGAAGEGGRQGAAERKEPSVPTQHMP